jgi:uncharacterized protein
LLEFEREMPDGGETPRPERPGEKLDRWLTRASLTRASAARLALGIALGFAGALLAIAIHLPLPWFLGSLIACLIASVAQVPFDRPVQLSVAMRAILGVAVGTAFAPELLGRFGSMTVSLLLLFPFMILIIGLGMLYFERIAGYNRPTAFFCAVPGGLTDMVTMAEDAGANPRTVTLIQATRIVMILFLLPFWLQWVGGKTIGIFVPGAVHLNQLLLVDAVILVALGWIGWRLAERLGLAGAPLVGPMILSGLAHGLGLTEAKIPQELLIVAQVTLGVLLGAQFRGLTWREFSSTMMWGAGFSLALVVATGIIAVTVSWLTGIDSTTVLLAYAPGGQTEMNLLAYILHLDVAFTALHHLVRLAIVIFGAQLVFRANPGWRPPPRK